MKKIARKELPLRPAFREKLDEARRLQLEADKLKTDVYETLRCELIQKYELQQSPYFLSLVYGGCVEEEACIYDDIEDPSHDMCLFCGEPYERK